MIATCTVSTNSLSVFFFAGLLRPLTFQQTNSIAVYDIGTHELRVTSARRLDGYPCTLLHLAGQVCRNNLAKNRCYRPQMLLLDWGVEHLP